SADSAVGRGIRRRCRADSRGDGGGGKRRRRADARLRAASVCDDRLARVDVGPTKVGLAELASRQRQNIYLRLSCTSRRASVFAMTRPKFALVGSAVMKPEVDAEPAMRSQFGWLMKLNISARNWIFCVPATRKFLNSAMSHCCSPGLRRP